MPHLNIQHPRPAARPFIRWVWVALLLLPACDRDGGDVAITGTILAERGDNLGALAQIDEDAARAAAESAVPGGDAEEAELEIEGGYLVYAVDVEKKGEEIEVLIDAGNGAVLRLEDDDEAGDEHEGVEAELPAAVMEAFRRAYPEAVLIGSDTETEDGNRFYEIESRDDDTRRDLLYLPDGTLYETEESVDAGALPEGVRTAGLALGRIVTAERVQRGSATTYELLIEAQGKREEMAFSETGSRIE